MSHLDYTKIFEEVRDHLVRCLPSDADVVFDADRPVIDGALRFASH